MYTYSYPQCRNFLPNHKWSILAGLPFIITFTCYNAGVPSVNNLTFNGSSNTLTCTSTGGPATNVTWRRNGIVITLNATNQQTQIVTNTTNGTYQTVLTIDSSVSQSDIVGTYNCAVENVRGRSSVTVVVGETWNFIAWLQTCDLCTLIYAVCMVHHRANYQLLPGKIFVVLLAHQCKLGSSIWPVMTGNCKLYLLKYKFNCAMHWCARK